MSEDKKPKKIVKKAEKKSADKSDANTISLVTLAKEAKLKGASARAKLRAAGLKPDGRWTWKKGSSELKKAREALGL
jgi:hypothetical protein